MSAHDLYLTENIRALERLIIAELSVPGYTLMERAGKAAFAALQGHWPMCKTISVVCGRGNNAGDGYIVARLAHEAGYQVRVFSLITFGHLHGDALLAARAAAVAGVTLIDCESRLPDMSMLSADVIVDAIFGIGLDRPVTGRWLEVIEIINNTGRPVLALDVPSGLNVDTGAILGGAIKAACTVTFIARKQGMFTGLGRHYCGQVQLADLAIDSARAEVSARLISYPSVSADLLKPRGACSHKGQHGHVLLVGGDFSMSGAICLAGEAALRSGTGRVSLATRPQHAALLALARPELMSHGVAQASQLKPLLDKTTAIAVGPGLGRGAWSHQLFARLLECDHPMVVDADGLNLLAEEPVSKDNWILTPHPGEAARLLGVSVMDIEADRFAAVRSIQQRYGGIVILKGAGSLVCYGENQSIDICSEGNPGMAVAGMGDVLTGVIVSMLAQRFNLEQAARLGVCLHSAAADVAACDGQRGMLASDLFPHLRTLINLSNGVVE